MIYLNHWIKPCLKPNLCWFSGPQTQVTRLEIILPSEILPYNHVKLDAHQEKGCFATSPWQSSLHREPCEAVFLRADRHPLPAFSRRSPLVFLDQDLYEKCSFVLSFLSFCPEWSEPRPAPSEKSLRPAWREPQPQHRPASVCPAA